MRLRIVYVVSDVDKALSFEWLALALSKKFTISFLLIGRQNTVLAQFLSTHGIFFSEVSDEKYSSWLSKWIAVFQYIRSQQPDIVHTHLWRANLLGLSAAWLLRVKKRIFTRHHATIHYDQFPAGRKWDKLCNYLATDIIAISQNIYNILFSRDGAKKKKIRVVHHGFDLSYFQHTAAIDIRELREKYSLGFARRPILGVIARYVDWKGIEFIIRAFKKLRNDFPKAHLILANASGDYRSSILAELAELPPDSFTEIVFEENLSQLYRLFDVYVHAPVNPNVEAFGQTYVEALAAGIPSVFTLSGVAAEFISHEYNALVVPFRDSDGIYYAVKRVLENKDLQEKMISNGKNSASLFSLDKMIGQLTELYEE